MRKNPISPLAGAILLALALTQVLSACGAPQPRAVSADAIYRPPVFGGWVQIDGRWDVIYGDGAGHALLQPAVDRGRIDNGDRDTSRNAVETRWVDDTTGETLWSRTDIGELIYTDGAGEAMVAAAGSGADRQIESIDLETGETIWAIPENGLGECQGWRYFDDRDVDGVATITLAAPPTCGTGQRTLLAQLDPATGEAKPLLVGAGSIDVALTEDHIVIAAWTTVGGTVHLVDRETAESTASIPLSPAQVYEGTGLARSSELTQETALELNAAVTAGRIWVQATWNDPNDDRTTDYLLNEFLLDLDAATAERSVNAACDYEGDADSWWYNWDAAALVCLTMGAETGFGTVVSGIGDSATAWEFPVEGDGPSWVRATCEPPDGGDDRPLLLVPAADALIRAYDIATGEVAWIAGEGIPGAAVSIATNRAADRMIAVSEDASGAQQLHVLSLCTGAVQSEQAVAGAHLGGAYLSNSSQVVGVALTATTLIGHYMPARGAEPEEDARA